MNKTHKSSLETLKKSGKIDFVDWALETGDGTKINNVLEEVLLRSLKSLPVCVKYGVSWIICTRAVYALEICNLDKRILQSLDFTVNRFSEDQAYGLSEENLLQLSLCNE